MLSFILFLGSAVAFIASADLYASETWNVGEIGDCVERLNTRLRELELTLEEEAIDAQLQELGFKLDDLPDRIEQAALVFHTAPAMEEPISARFVI